MVFVNQEVVVLVVAILRLIEIKNVEVHASECCSANCDNHLGQWIQGVCKP
jgi:hypothetical protein